MENLDRYTCRYIKLHTYVVLPNLSKYILSNPLHIFANMLFYFLDLYTLYPIPYVVVKMDFNHEFSETQNFPIKISHAESKRKQEIPGTE